MEVPKVVDLNHKGLSSLGLDRSKTKWASVHKMVVVLVDNSKRKPFDWPVRGCIYTTHEVVEHMKQLLERIELLEAEMDTHCKWIEYRDSVDRSKF